MYGQQQPPAIGQPADLRPGQRQQRCWITLLRYLVKQVKAAKDSRVQRVIQRMVHGSFALPSAWPRAWRNR
jgi:type IV secretory pathway protease TraF